MSTVVLRSVLVEGQLTGVRVRDGLIEVIDPDLGVGGDELVLDGDGGALIPGLHDHHIHLTSMAAADSSLQLGGRDLDRTIRTDHASRTPGEWVRAVGYDEAASGPLDRFRLDALAPGRPIRVQHRSGAMWVLSSAAMASVADDPDLAGIERDEHGAPTGRMFRLDGWLRGQLPATTAPDVEAVTRRLAGFGVTGVTDATPFESITDLELLARPGLSVGVVAMGGSALTTTAFPPSVGRGAVKIVIGDDDLPSPGDLADAFAAAHQADRSVAVHCVTRVGLALALAGWDAAGVAPGDRVEHGAVVAPDQRARLAELGLTVVTQPGFVEARGDRYLTDVDPEDQPYLYPCASLRTAGIEVGGSTDAPFGPEDPWVAIGTAIDRRTSGGIVLGRDERLAPIDALGLFLSSPDRPGGPPRLVAVGQPADLCLLDRSVESMLDDPNADHVQATMAAGAITFRRDD